MQVTRWRRAFAMEIRRTTHTTPPPPLPALATRSWRAYSRGIVQPIELLGAPPSSRSLLGTQRNNDDDKINKGSFNTTPVARHSISATPLSLQRRADLLLQVFRGVGSQATRMPMLIAHTNLLLMQRNQPSLFTAAPRTRSSQVPQVAALRFGVPDVRSVTIL